MCTLDDILDVGSKFQYSMQAITLTSDIPTWRIKCPQSRKNCRIYPTKCRINVLERKLLCPIIRNWFSA